MDPEFTNKWYGLWWRIPIAAVFLFFALRFFLQATGSGGFGVVGFVLFAVACLTAAAMVMSPVFAAVASHCLFGWIPGLIFPERTSTRPTPVYSPAEAKRMAGQTEEALRAYEEILEEFPDDPRAYLAMIDIAWQDLKDASHAKRYYDRAREVVTDEEYLDEMRMAYEDFAPYLPEDGAQPAGRRRITE